MGPMYPSYVPYAPQGYYGMPPQFQTGGVPSQGYMAYQGYARSPPTMPHYVPMVGVSVPPNYARPSPHSPNLSTSYQPPPAPAPIPPQTPSSSHSSQILPPPTPPTPPTVPPSALASVAAPPPPPPPAHPLHHSPVEQREPFRPPVSLPCGVFPDRCPLLTAIKLPWFSCPDTSFPAKTPRSRRRRKPLTADSAAVSLPLEQHGSLTEHDPPSSASVKDADVSSHVPIDKGCTKKSSHGGDLPETTAVSSNPLLYSSRQPGTDAKTAAAAPVDERSACLTHPVLPALPRPASKALSGNKPDESRNQTTNEGDKPAVNGAATPVVPEALEPDHAASANDVSAASPPTKAAPGSWAGLFAKTQTKAPVTPAGTNGAAALNGSVTPETSAAAPSSIFSKTTANSVAEAIREYQVGSGDRISFLEPRGLINTGNMCYMNSVRSSACRVRLLGTPV